MVREILGTLPPDFDIEKAQSRYPVVYEESLNQVLCQEMLRYNRLTGIIRNSLVNLDKAVQGLQVMSSELDTVRPTQAGRPMQAPDPPAWPGNWHASQARPGQALRGTRAGTGRDNVHLCVCMLAACPQLGAACVRWKPMRCADGLRRACTLYRQQCKRLLLRWS